MQSIENRSFSPATATYSNNTAEGDKPTESSTEQCSNKEEEDKKMQDKENKEDKETFKINPDGSVYRQKNQVWTQVSPPTFPQEDSEQILF